MKRTNQSQMADNITSQTCENPSNYFALEQASSQAKYKAIIGMVRRVPPGSVATYGQIANMVGLPGRARMVGKALGCALAMSDVPWFRIIRSDGRIAFGADTVQGKAQKMRLQNEGVAVQVMRVNLKHYQWQPALL